MNSLHCNKAVFGNRVFHQAGVYQRSSSWAFGLPGIPGRLPTSPSAHPLGPAFSLLLAISSAGGTTPTFFSHNSSSFVVTIFIIFCHHFDQTPSGVKPKKYLRVFFSHKRSRQPPTWQRDLKRMMSCCSAIACDQSGWSEDPSVGRPRWKLTQAVGMIRRRRSEPTSRDVPTERPPSFFYP